MSGQQHAPAALYPRERPGAHFTGGWVDPRTGLERCVKSRPHRDSIPDRPARSQLLYRLSYRAHNITTVLYLYILHILTVVLRRTDESCLVYKSIYSEEKLRPASWSCSQSLCLLTMTSRVRFPALPWEFSLKGKILAVTMFWVD